MRRRGPATEASQKEPVHAQERETSRKGPHSGQHSLHLVGVETKATATAANKGRMSNRIASAIILACGLCVLSFMLFGGNDPGRTFFSNLGESWLSDKKGGVNLIFMAFPILLAGSVATLCATTPPLHPLTISAKTVHSIVPRWIQRWRYRVLQGSSASMSSGGDWNITAIAITFIFIPSMVYLSMVNYRHFHGKQKGLDDQLMHIGNSFGVMAEVVSSFLLIPVSKHSSLLKYVGWSPARAVPLHIWSGRIFVIGGIVHGLFHTVRWKFLAGESVISMLIPPAPCWTMDNNQYSSYEPACVDKDTDCSCYDHFRNLTGYSSGFFMLVIAITSLHQVRRKFFRIFYLSHVVAAPLALILLVFHWNRSILYICPSLLYYAANSLTVMVESRTQCTRHQGVKIVTVERIPSLPSQQGSHYISLTLEATNIAIQRFRPGYYIQLKSPDVSFISHPFTINIVPGESSQMRIIFKAMGQFTSKLSQQMQNAIPDQQSNLTSAIDNMPKIYLDGYHGTPNRVSEVVQHDVAVLICGGIGITPYLSLLLQVHDILVQGEGVLPTKQVVLVWMCREQSLIDYVKREYLESLLQAPNNGHSVDFKFKVVVYHTVGDDNLSSRASYSDGEDAALDTQKGPSAVLASKTEVLSMGVPFTPSRFAVGSSKHWKTNIQAFGAFSIISWGGLWCTWFLYKNHTDKHQVASRGWALMAIGILGLSVAFLANFLAARSYFDDDFPSEEMNGDDGCIPLKANSEDFDGLVRSSSPNAVELEDLHQTGEHLQKNLHGESAASSATGSGGSSEIVTMEEKAGRPSVHQMLKYVDSAQCPGVFTCGPVGLMKDVREHIIEMRRASLEGIALYEEAFEL